MGTTRRTRRSRGSTSPSFMTGILLVAGLLYFSAGLALLFEPVWFFENIGTFPPFNSHYMGDLGGFLVPLGIGLLVASQNPTQNRMVVAIGAGGTTLLTLNHLFHSISSAQPLSTWFIGTIPLLIFSALFLWAMVLNLPGRR